MFITPPENGGQMVEVSYALVGNYVYQRRYDKSDGSLTFYRSKALNKDSGDYQNGAPKNKQWARVHVFESNGMYMFPEQLFKGF